MCECEIIKRIILYFRFKPVLGSRDTYYMTDSEINQTSAGKQLEQLASAHDSDYTKLACSAEKQQQGGDEVGQSSSST